MRPLEILQAKKALGTLKIEENNPFFTLPLTINNKDIAMDFEAYAKNEEVFGLTQFGQLKMALDVSGNGEVKLLATHLSQTMKQMLEQETLPELKLVVNSFVFNDTISVTWPKRKDFQAITYKKGDKSYQVVPEDSDAYGHLVDDIKKHRAVTVETELYCWARQDYDKHELIVGFTPRIKSITI